MIRALLLGAAVGALSQTRRGRRTLHVALGRPIAYRMHAKDGTVLVSLPHTLIDSCTFESATIAAPPSPGDARRETADSLDDGEPQ